MRSCFISFAAASGSFLCTPSSLLLTVCAHNAQALCPQFPSTAVLCCAVCAWEYCKATCCLCWFKVSCHAMLCRATLCRAVPDTWPQSLWFKLTSGLDMLQLFQPGVAVMARQLLSNHTLMQVSQSSSRSEPLSVRV